MASKLSHSVSYPFSIDRLWQVICTEQYWRDLLEATNSSHGRLDSFEHDGNTVSIEMQQGVPEDQLPSMITAVRPGDLHIPRRISFTREGDTITGKMGATVKGAPAKVKGKLSASGDPARIDYRASVEVSIPFLGSNIERGIIDQLVALLDNEQEKTVTWEAAHR
ncbi:hypothetical protein GCM10009624_15490 [Gordonia sinesedis]